ncbi:error-prone DNA polymerase [Corynebacterium bovis]|uniref:error-prone DNA polymerase n=1 Tax=Corynebacterium bovis TaxID=36808 RepID=UPI002449D5E9|nr:error-prone DNA polymerase [Corynebacterium bovis]MDH2455600.1 error-prone DNA polymerase [Corynebacterium bovis]
MAGFSNAAPLRWSQLERILSGEGAGTLVPGGVAGRRAGSVAARGGGGEGDDVPLTPAVTCAQPAAELHAAGSYSFLRGASDPEEYVAVAADLGVTVLCLMDRDGFYGAARTAVAAAEAGVGTVFGVELSVDGTGEPPLTVICRGQEGYRRASRAVTAAKMAVRDKDGAVYPPLEELAVQAGGHWTVLVDPSWAGRADRLVELFGADRCVVELRQTMDPADVDDNATLHGVADRLGLREIVTALPTCASPGRARLSAAKTALHVREDVGAASPRTHPAGGSWLRSGEELLALAGDCAWLRDAVGATVALAEECAFTLDLVAPGLPRLPVPDGSTEADRLRELTEAGARERYGTREDAPRAWAVIDRELGVIGDLGFPGYFLIVHDIVHFCHESGILCQGRGSAANSAVCFALGVTNVDAVAAGLLFERFLSPERDGPPDIDLDIESGRREEVIQYVYRRYGRDNAAQVANVITYRRKAALRDAGRALGYDQGRIDGWTRALAEGGGRAGRGGRGGGAGRGNGAGRDGGAGHDPGAVPEQVLALADQLRGQPRHLGIHSGGMVICDRPIADVVPTEWARMEDRSVVQWDKDDCAAVGLVKFDLLGLGMLEVLHHAVDLVEEHRGRRVDLWRLTPDDPGVYDMLCRGDAVGVFQVESRAQLATLPRLRPRRFFDLVVEVALIRPGPIQGGSVHPYIRRRNGKEPVTYDHPCLRPALEKTLGVPLFQEQLMQLVVDAAGFTPAEADTLRRAMGSKRSPEKMARLRGRFYDGLRREHGITGSVADGLWDRIVAFASYGFPESHAQSFASLVYFSAWFKYHYPAEFCVALLRSQPMGFYSPQSLVADARRHGVTILPVDVNASAVEADVERPGGAATGPGADPGAIRLGLGSVRGLGDPAAARIVAARERIGRFAQVTDLAREADLGVAAVERLARAGALDSLGLDRRQAVWVAGTAATERPGMLPGTSGCTAPALPGMSAIDLAVADVAATGVTADGHPVRLLREHLDRRGVVPAARLTAVEDGRRIRVAGVVTHRQRPHTASGVIFLGLEDETGLANIMVSPGLWRRCRATGTVVVRGIVENASGAATVRADLIEPLDIAGVPGLRAISGPSRDFR